MCLRCLGMKHDCTDGTKKRWSRLFAIAKLRLLSRGLNILFRNLYFMNLISYFLKTKYTLSIEFVLAQVRGNNHWRTSQVRLEILNDRTLFKTLLHTIKTVKNSSCMKENRPCKSGSLPRCCSIFREGRNI
jgi:hypothetical protein